MSTSPAPRHVVVAGGGVGALESAISLRELAGDRVAVTLVAPDRVFAYRPLAVAEPFGTGEVVRYELAAVARTLGVTLVRDAVDAVDADASRVLTQDGAALHYDALVLALGTHARAAVPGAIAFRGPRDVDRVRALLGELERAGGGHLAFAVPHGATWTLPIHELALLATAWARRAGIDLATTLVTPEDAPLEAFGRAASARVGALLADRGTDVRTRTLAACVEDGRLWTAPGGALRVDAAIALPRLTGPAIPGLPADAAGFVPVDELGRVPGLDHVYAIGDMTQRPVKQGGLAAQHADAAAAAIAAWAGAPIRPEPADGILRGLLLTGEQPMWLRHPAVPEPAGGPPLWWPAHKIAARRLAPWLAANDHLAERGSDTRAAPRYARVA